MAKDNKKVDIHALSELARIDVAAEEEKELKESIESILEYVQQIQEVAGGEDAPSVDLASNVMREDENPHEAGKYTDALLSEVPKIQKGEEGTYVEVKQIL